MTQYQDLCQLFQQQQTKRKSFEQVLRDEVKTIVEQLATKLALKGKYYRKSVSDEQATQPYVFVGKETFRETYDTYPEMVFDLTVVLEQDEETYPKKPYSQLIEVGFIQADRLYFRFIQARPEVRLVVNLNDDDEIKYRHLVQAYLDLLMKTLTKGE